MFFLQLVVADCQVAQKKKISMSFTINALFIGHKKECLLVLIFKQVAEHQACSEFSATSSKSIR